jgi:hypothetical protein
MWNLRLLIEPFDHESKLLAGNVSLLNALEQMCIQLPRQVAAQNPWHSSLAVKSACHGGL